MFFKIIKRSFYKSNINLEGDSSVRWLQRHINDEYVKKSRYENFRARSAFKLIEIDEKYDIIKPGFIVIDLGASPGSWTQVSTRIMGLNTETTKLKKKSCNKTTINNSLVIAVDILPINPIEGAVTIGNVDFTKSLNQSKIISLLNDRKVDVVLSDMAPNASGVKDVDVPNIIKLAKSSLQFAIQILKPKTGTYLTKLFTGKEIFDFQDKYVKKFFDNVKLIKPPSSRSDSSEVFLLARNFKGIKEKL